MAEKEMNHHLIDKYYDSYNDEFDVTDLALDEDTQITRQYNFNNMLICYYTNKGKIVLD